MQLSAMRKGLVVTLLLLMLASGLVWAEGRLEGVVKDPSGKGIKGVVIKLVPSLEGLPIVKVRTDKKGRFILGLIRKANYRIAALKEGWRVTYLDGNIAIPRDESFWKYDAPVSPGTEPPELSINGVSIVTYNLTMAPDSGGGGEWGMGVSLRPLDELVAELKDGDAEHVARELERHLVAKPEDANVNYLYGFALFSAGDLAGAKNAVARALKSDERFEGANLLMGKILEKQEKLDEAAEYYGYETQYAQNEGVQHEAWLAAAVLAIKKGDHERAIKALETVIAQRPDDVAALLELGNLYLQMGEKEKASAILEKVASLGGAQDPAVLYNLGADAYNKREYAKAAELFVKVIALKDDFAEAHLLLGNARLNLGDQEGAVVSFRRFLELRPDDPQASFAQQMVDALGTK